MSVACIEIQRDVLRIAFSRKRTAPSRGESWGLTREGKHATTNPNGTVSFRTQLMMRRRRPIDGRHCLPFRIKGHMCICIYIPLSLSIYIYIYVYIYIYIYIYASIDIHYISIYVSLSLYIYIYVYMYLSLSLYIYIYVYICIYLCMYVYISLSICVYVYVCVYICVYIYIYMFIHRPPARSTRWPLCACPSMPKTFRPPPCFLCITPRERLVGGSSPPAFAP